MKRRLHILLLLLLQVSFLMAQGFTVRECYESEIPSAKRADYYKEAHRIIETHYILLLESVGESENREVIIEQMMSDKNINTLKTEFLLTQDNNLSFCSPQQYFTRFEFVYKELAKEVEFIVDNFKDGKIMMNSLVSCYIPIEYDLTLMQGDNTLFKRRCRMYCLFPKANASKLTKVMQVEPVEEIYNVNKFKASSEGTLSFIDKFVIKFKTWSIADKIFGVFMLILLVGSCIFGILGLYAIYLDDRIKNLLKHIRNKRQFKQLLSQAKAGDVDAMKELAAIYEYGNKSGNLSSNPESFKWYLNAAQKDDTESIYKVATCYEYGWGVEEDVTKAVVYYKKAAEFNHAEAQYQLGKHYQKGEGIIQSDKDAVEWFTRAAVRGHASAQFEMGLCYFKGVGVEQSYEKAVEWYTKAAEQGVADALYQLGECYYNGWGVEVDYKRAVENYGWAGLGGHKEAIYTTAMCYKSGIGTIQSDEQAFILFSRAYNHTGALYEMGLCYLEGRGVQQSTDKAVQCFTKAAEQGHEEAKKTLERFKNK